MYSKSTNIWSSFAYLCVKVSHNCEEGLYLVDLDPGRLTHFVDSGQNIATIRLELSSSKLSRVKYSCLEVTFEVIF